MTPKQVIIKYVLLFLFLTGVTLGCVILAGVMISLWYLFVVAFFGKGMIAFFVLVCGVIAIVGSMVATVYWFCDEEKREEKK
jgi:hypothetical protein